MLCKQHVNVDRVLCKLMHFNCDYPRTQYINSVFFSSVSRSGLAIIMAVVVVVMGLFFGKKKPFVVGRLPVYGPTDFVVYGTGSAVW